jgi:hypothetical protein
MSKESRTPASASRFDRNTLVYLTGLCMLFIGLSAVYSMGIALLVVGATLTGVSIATSFFVTWLSLKEQ